MADFFFGGISATIFITLFVYTFCTQTGAIMSAEAS